MLSYWWLSYLTVSIVSWFILHNLDPATSSQRAYHWGEAWAHRIAQYPTFEKYWTWLIQGYLLRELRVFLWLSLRFCEGLSLEPPQSPSAGFSDSDAHLFEPVSEPDLSPLSPEGEESIFLPQTPEPHSPNSSQNPSLDLLETLPTDPLEDPIMREDQLHLAETESESASEGEILEQMSTLQEADPTPSQDLDQFLASDESPDQLPLNQEDHSPVGLMISEEETPEDQFMVQKKNGVIFIQPPKKE